MTVTDGDSLSLRIVRLPKSRMSHTGSLFTLWIALSQSQDTARQTTGAAHAHATDRQRRESANTKSTHYFISKLQSTLPQRKEYEQGITTMEDDEELMTIEISALLCSIISQGRELKTMRNIE